MHRNVWKSYRRVKTKETVESWHISTWGKNYRSWSSWNLSCFWKDLEAKERTRKSREVLVLLLLSPEMLPHWYIPIVCRNDLSYLLTDALMTRLIMNFEGRVVRSCTAIYNLFLCKTGLLVMRKHCELSGLKVKILKEPVVLRSLNCLVTLRNKRSGQEKKQAHVYLFLVKYRAYRSMYWTQELLKEVSRTSMQFVTCLW